jgi:hypothetical protein
MDTLRVDVVGQGKRAFERAVEALGAVQGLAFHLLRFLALALDRQHAVLEEDLHVLLPHVGQVDLDEILLFPFDHVGGRHELIAALGPGQRRHPAKHGRKALQQVVHLAQRFPSHQSHGALLGCPLGKPGLGPDRPRPRLHFRGCGRR